MQLPRDVVHVRERHYTFRKLCFRTALPQAFFVPAQSVLLFHNMLVFRIQALQVVALFVLLTAKLVIQPPRLRLPMKWRRTKSSYGK
eukprot:5833541-Amphidinium_carterae.1